MFRLTQTVRNLFLRLQGLVDVLFKSVSSFFGNLFGFFANLFGFTSSGYFLESNQEQAIKQVSAKEPIETNQDKIPTISATTRHPSNAKIDNYFLNMARDVKKK